MLSTSGVFTTGMPRARAAAMSIWSNPTLNVPITFTLVRQLGDRVGVQPLRRAAQDRRRALGAGQDVGAGHRRSSGLSRAS